MGRNRKLSVNSTGKISKEEKKKRQEAEAQIKVKSDQLLTPPEFLNERASQEFLRVAKESQELGILDNLDFTFIVIYAEAWDNYCTCSENIAKHGMIQTKELTTGSYEVPSVYVKLQAHFIKQIMHCSSKLGLAVTDRLRLVIPKEEEKTNKFLDLLTK